MKQVAGAEVITGKFSRTKTARAQPSRGKTGPARSQAKFASFRLVSAARCRRQLAAGRQRRW